MIRILTVQSEPTNAGKGGQTAARVYDETRSMRIVAQVHVDVVVAECFVPAYLHSPLAEGTPHNDHYQDAHHLHTVYLHIIYTIVWMNRIDALLIVRT